MPVYVDDLNWQLNGNMMSHMIADNFDELHIFALTIGVSRDWFDPNPRHPHYDITAAEKEIAIQKGAKSINTIQAMKIMKQQYRVNQMKEMNETKNV